MHVWQLLQNSINQDVLKTKQFLFGSKEKLSKISFKNDSKYVLYEYNKNNNIYVGLGLQGGGYCEIAVEYKIESVNVVDDKLDIVVAQKVFNYNAETSEKATVKSDNKLQYVFKKQNSNYYLAEINKLS